MPASKSYKEFIVHDTILEMVDQELKKIKKKVNRDDDDILRLEKLTRMYATIMDQFRSNIKEDLLSKVLEKAGPQSEEDGDE